MAMGRPLTGSARKRVLAVRIDPELLAAVRAASSNTSRTVEDALRLWLARERRKAAKAGADPLARHLAPRTAREIASRCTDDAA
jgi:post-segregation antitoxin (ccd killing protein)